MIRKTLLLISFICNISFAQYNLNYFINKAVDNSPVINNYNNLGLINNLQKQLDEAQNSSFQLSLTSNYLFAPFFNDNGHYVSTNPDPNAIGYDAAITNGGLYSAQINLEKNIFNGGMLNALNEQNLILGKDYKNKTEEEKHTLKKQVTDQYFNSLRYLLLYHLSKQVENNMNEQLTITGNLVKNGYAKAQDYLLLKVEMKTDIINTDQAWQNYKSSLAQLYSLCGIVDTQTVTIDSIGLEYQSFAGRSKFLNQYRLDSLTAESQQKVFETKYDPQIQLFVNAGLNAVELNDLQRKFGMSAGVNFSLPILDGGQKGITEQQTLIAEKSLADYKNYSQKNITIQRQDAGERISSLKKNLADYKAQIDDYNNLLNLSEKQLQQGSMTMIDYLSLLRNYIDMKKNYISTVIDYQLEINNYNYWNW
jgi:outer membrane protein TolC